MSEVREAVKILQNVESYFSAVDPDKFHFNGENVLHLVRKILSLLNANAAKVERVREGEGNDA